MFRTRRRSPLVAMLLACLISSSVALAPAATATASAGNPLLGVRWFINHQYGLANVQERAYRAAHQWRLAALMHKIAAEPQTERYGSWSPDVGTEARQYLRHVDQTEPGTVPVFATYDVNHGPCGGHADSPSGRAAYRGWINLFARAVGGHPAVVYLEQDALITLGCLSRAGLQIRLSELAYASSVLGSLPRTSTYMDAGAADGDPSPARMARLLRRAGVAHIRGFFLNSTHFDWTSKELRFGDRIARILRDHFIVSTAVNGRGPAVPRDRVHNGNEVLCNPSGRALGPKPTTNTGDPLADAFAWVGNPGRSGGACHPGDPGTGVWYPRYALGLAARADW